MSFSNPGHRIPRRSVAGHEGEWVKTFDPPAADRRDYPGTFGSDKPSACICCPDSTGC